jgi:hypothetical protein
VLRRIRSHLTYVNVVGSLALFIALGGVSYAAIKLPKNSVGAQQIKANSITSPKIKGKGLSAADFAKPSGPAAAAIQGDPGPQGPKGPKGDEGEPGDPGLVNTGNWFEGSRVAQISIDGGVIASLKGYRVDCDSLAQACTLKVGGFTTGNEALTSWYEQAIAAPGSAAATKSFSLTEFASPGGSATRRYHVTNGRPIARRLEDDRFEITFTSEFIQRVSV